MVKPSVREKGLLAGNVAPRASPTQQFTHLGFTIQPITVEELQFTIPVLGD